MIWKLLRQHVSALQLLGFFVANLLGMLIVLLALQFYRDVRPVFSQEDGIINNDYLILSKHISTMGLTSTAFSQREMDELKSQPFTRSVGAFTASQYKVSCSMGIEGVANFGTQMYFESVPDRYVDADRSQWHYAEGDPVVPIILPRSYLAIYNFGFAQSRSLPKLSEGVISMLNMTVVLRGNGREQRMQGKIVGFTNRLQTILVPESFMTWSNREFAPDDDASPTRLIVEVGNPTDDRITRYVNEHGLDVDEDKLEAGKTTYFLKVLSGIVMGIGLLISVLSFFILMLSIYLLVQKNSEKLENLLLIGYSPSRVARPYQLLTIGLNALVVVIALIILVAVRNYYMSILQSLFPDVSRHGIMPAIIAGLTLFLIVSVLNILALRRKVMSILKRK